MKLETVKLETAEVPDAGPIPWRRIFRELSLAHGWAPSQIGELTIAQLKVYLAKEEESGRVKLAAGEARALARRLMKRKRDWIDSQLAVQGRCTEQPKANTTDA